ncbi:MAG: limonene-1,2-epoxide hydrolase family protein, partial [bacterium]
RRSQMTTSNETIVSNFVKEFDSSPDAARISAYFSDDAIYHNIPVAPIHGREAIANAIGGWKDRMQSAGWEIVHQVSNGDVVINERIDRFTVGDKNVSLPVVGVFELKDGKITAWRDYFDMNQFTSQFA